MSPIKTGTLMSRFHGEAAASTVQVPGSKRKKSAPVLRKSDLRPRMSTKDPRPWETLTPGKESNVLSYELVRNPQEKDSRLLYSGSHPRLQQAALPHPKL